VVSAALVLALWHIGCAGHDSIDLPTVYRSAARDRPQRNPVIVIPGLLGSALVDDRGNEVWGPFLRKGADPTKPDGARLIALPMRQGAKLRDLRDDVLSNDVLDRIGIKFLGLPIQLGPHANLLAMLEAGGYQCEETAPDVDCFEFAYDWRRDLSESAVALAAFIDQKRTLLETERRKRGISAGEIKFDILAHSIGGLLTRYYLRYGGQLLPDDGSVPALTWKGATNVEHVILVGTPNAGTVGTFRNLVLGFKLGPTLPRYDVAVVGTMPGPYQMLPRGRHGAIVRADDPQRAYQDLYDAELWERNGWGLASPECDKTLEWLLPEIPSAQERRSVALDHLRKSLTRARQFAEALDVPASPPESVSLYLVAGGAVPTSAVATFDSSSGKFEVLEEQAGDGKVLRTSALMDERAGRGPSSRLVSPIDWSQVIFLRSRHRDMTRDPALVDNVLFFLLEQPRTPAYEMSSARLESD